MTSLNPVGVSAAAKAPCPVCGKSIHALDGAMSSGGEPMRHMDCERAASIDYAAAFDILYRRALDNQRTVNALVEVTTQEDGEPWEHDGLLMQLYSDDSTSWSTYESCVLAVAGSPADERWECCGQVFTGTPDFISGARSAHVCPPEDVPDAETAYGLGKTAGLREVNDLRDQVQMYEEKAERDWRDFGEMQDARIAADDRVVALTRALEFYADANNYVGGEVGWWGKRIGGDPLWCMDFGVIARNALAGVSAEATGVWPDQSAQHAVLLEQIKDAYAEGKADAVALIRERAALALPDLARFTLDEVEAIVGLSAEAAPDGILDELRRPNDEPHVAPSSNPYPRDGATFAGSPEAIAYDRGFAAGLAARDTNEPKEKP